MRPDVYVTGGGVCGTGDVCGSGGVCGNGGVCGSGGVGLEELAPSSARSLSLMSMSELSVTMPQLSSSSMALNIIKMSL